MTVAGMLTPDSATAGYAPAPVLSTNSETFGATFDFMRTNMNVDSALRLNNEAYRSRDDLIRTRFGQDPMKISGAMEKYQSRDPEAIQTMLKYHQDQIDQFITKGRTTDPKKFDGLKTQSEVQEEARNKARMSKQQFEDIVSRNPNGISKHLSALSGGLAGGFTDPLNIATLPFGVGAGGSILKAALAEGALNAAVEVASQPAVSAWQKELGYKYGVGDMVENVGMAFAGGAGLAAVIRGAVPAIRKTGDVLGSFSSHALDKIASSERLPVTVRDAAAYMSRVAHIDESAPPGLIKDDLDLVKHRDTVAQTANDFEQFREPTSIQTEGAAPKLDDVRAWEDQPVTASDVDAEAIPQQVVAKDIEELQGRLVEKDFGGVETAMTEDGAGDIVVHKIEVDKELRKQGFGTKAMEEITRYADAKGKRVMLSPSTDFGATSVKRLKDFYKRFGFVENKGANKDFTTKETMIREPVKTEAPKVKAAAVPKKSAPPQKGNLPPKSFQSNEGGADTASVPRPPVRPPEEIKAMDRIASKQATIAQLLKDEPDLKVTLEDGSTLSLKELHEEVQGDLAVIEALTTCRIA